MSEGWVRIMADYSSDGLWRRDGLMVSREDLPVSDSLRERHVAWCRWYEDGQFYMPMTERTVEFDVKAFAAEGLEIARATKAELPGWTVVYYEEAAAQRTAADAPRWTFECTV